MGTLPEMHSLPGSSWANEQWGSGGLHGRECKPRARLSHEGFVLVRLLFIPPSQYLSR